jgi:hypothetical protein
MRVRTYCRCILIPGLAALATIPMLARSSDGIQKSLFVSVVDDSGNPVKDMAGDDFRIREDGTDRQIIAVKHASQPISVEVLVDTAQGNRVTDAYGTPEEYTRDIRVAVGGFGRKLLGQSPDARVSLMEFGQAARPIVPLTTSPMDFEKGVNRLAPIPNVGSVLLEALVAANDDLAQQKSTRRAIVSVNLEPSQDESRQVPKEVVAAFRKSSAQLWAVSIHRGALKNSQRDVVLNEFAKATGGQRDFVVGISAVGSILERYADALTFQYEIVYDRPESKKPPQVVQVGVAREGKFHTHASGFPPQ